MHAELQKATHCPPRCGSNRRSHDGKLRIVKEAGSASLRDDVGTKAGFPGQKTQGTARDITEVQVVQMMLFENV